VPTAETTASWSFRAAVSDSTDSKSTWATLTEGSKVFLEEARWRAVMLNFPESMRAWRIGFPMVPAA
jgi:hypothetical protein